LSFFRQLERKKVCSSILFSQHRNSPNRLAAYSHKPAGLLLGDGARSGCCGSLVAGRSCCRCSCLCRCFARCCRSGRLPPPAKRRPCPGAQHRVGGPFAQLWWPRGDGVPWGDAGCRCSPGCKETVGRGLRRWKRFDRRCWSGIFLFDGRLIVSSLGPGPHLNSVSASISGRDYKKKSSSFAWRY